MNHDLRIGPITAEQIHAGPIVTGARCRLALPYDRIPSPVKVAAIRQQEW